MDYAHAKDIADFWNTNVFKYLDYKLSPPVSSPVEFLNAVENSNSGANKYIPFNCPFLFDVSKFLSKYSDNCYFYIHPRAGEEGMIRPYHWFPERSIMVDSKPCVWVENKLILSHLTFVAYGKSFADLINFQNENLDLVKTESEEPKFGFLANVK